MTNNGDKELRTASNILQHELIGMEVEITKCTLSEKCSTHGLIIDETRNMLVFQQESNEIEIPKLGTKIKFKVPADVNAPGQLIEHEVDCELLIARPEDRVKKNEKKTRRK